MAISVRKKQALNNLTHFKHKVLRKEQRLEDDAHNERVRIYTVLMHTNTGDMRFLKMNETEQDLIDELEDADGWERKDWKVLHLHVKNPEGPHQKQSFSLYNERDKEFDRSALEKSAQTVMQETLRILNEGVEGYKGSARIEDYVLDDLTRFEYVPAETDVLDTPAYKGNISRIQAEKLLEKRKVGTYLLRDSSEMSGFRVCYDIENCIICKGYGLTVKTSEYKISEYLLLKNDEWMIYDDDPDFKHQAKHYVSFADLLKTIPDARYPFV